jgi:hypothetical protein
MTGAVLLVGRCLRRGLAASLSTLRVKQRPHPPPAPPLDAGGAYPRGMATVTEETHPPDYAGAVRTVYHYVDANGDACDEADAVAVYFTGYDAEGNQVSSGMGRGQALGR